jgi:chloramphenicol 3-O phosphotransferase
MSAKSRIVILNGVGSAGKGSIARSLQSITTAPFLHVEMDAFIDMLPAATFGHPEGLTFERIEQDGKPSVVIKTGFVAKRALRGMRYAIAAMAGQGNNLIVDEVMLGRSEPDYAVLLADYVIFLVGVFAPLEVLEARERQRGDRLIGLARWQFDRVHKDLTYDLEIDTTTATPLECAQMIRDTFHL